MNFVDDVDFIFCADGKMNDFFADFTRFIHLSVCGGVNFNHVHAAFFCDCKTGTAFAAGFAVFGMLTVECFRKNTGGCCFSDPAWTDEQISLCDTVVGNCVFQRACNMFLSDHVGKFLRTPLSCYNLICHKITSVNLRCGQTDRKRFLPDRGKR